MSAVFSGLLAVCLVPLIARGADKHFETLTIGDDVYRDVTVTRVTETDVYSTYMPAGFALGAGPAKVRDEEESAGCGEALHRLPESARVRQLMQEIGGEDDIVLFPSQCEPGKRPRNQYDPLLETPSCQHASGLGEHGRRTLHGMDPPVMWQSCEPARDITGPAAEIQHRCPARKVGEPLLEKPRVGRVG